MVAIFVSIFGAIVYFLCTGPARRVDLTLNVFIGVCLLAGLFLWVMHRRDRRWLRRHEGALLVANRLQRHLPTSDLYGMHDGSVVVIDRAADGDTWVYERRDVDAIVDAHKDLGYYWDGAHGQFALERVMQETLARRVRAAGEALGFEYPECELRGLPRSRLLVIDRATRRIVATLSESDVLAVLAKHGIEPWFWRTPETIRYTLHESWDKPNKRSIFDVAARAGEPIVLL